MNCDINKPIVIFQRFRMGASMKQIKFILWLSFFVLSSQSMANTMEWNIDRPGKDIGRLTLPTANPHLCKTRCENNSRCKAWTYVKPNTIQGPRPQCWIKHTVPSKRPNKCCISGVKTNKPVAPGLAEWNIDRPGSDYKNFNLPQPNAALCRNACTKEAKCKSWTYVKPNTTQGPNPRCWLKHAVPKPRKNNCCVSGVKKKRVPATFVGAELNIDRPGFDYKNFNLPKRNAALCRNACAKEAKCKAWTYVKPNTTQGPNPRCWLKHTVPKPRKNNCCVSGVKRVAVTPPPAKMGNLEWNIDRRGADFRNFNLAKANPNLCRNACARDGRCKAWTYVKPNTVQGPKPRCWLKNRIPAKTPSSCCISGIKK